MTGIIGDGKIPAPRDQSEAERPGFDVRHKQGQTGAAVDAASVGMFSGIPQDVGFTIPVSYDVRERSESQKLRARIRQFADELCSEYPSLMVSKSLVAAGANLVLEDPGPLAAISMMRHATNMLAGHWTDDFVELWAEDPNP